MITYDVTVNERGTIEWRLNGLRHREDGPAIECANGNKYWYLNGELLTDAEFNNRMNPAKEMTMAELEAALGHKLKVVK